MKRILFIAIADISKRKGVGLASLAYYNALCKIRPGQVDLMMPEEACIGKYSGAVGVPPRSHIKALVSGSMHRYKAFLYSYLLNNKGRYSLCIINGGRYAGDMMDMIHSFDLKIMVIHHNFEREYCMDNKTIYTLGGLTPFFVNRVEKMSYSKAECNCFLTPEDKVLFQKYYGIAKGKSYIIGVFEPEDIIITPVEQKPLKKIVITGSMNTLQTISGINDIRKNYYDIITDLCPNWNLVIAGRDPGKDVYDFAKLNMEVISVVPNPAVMDDITNTASLFLCPTNVGGGLKLRVMDGLRQGLPVLTHKVSARGYNVFWNKPYFQIYQDRASFRQGLLNLLNYVETGLDKKKIQSDYILNFSFNQGCKKIKEAVDSLGL